ncbi:hypothetical protein CEK27_012160 [Fusarium fujikuroi]|nr:hypothetical protein CEK27_012160 [Fusarium fujikuroi]
MTHNGGTLLLDDPIKDPFISAKYPSKATKHLKPYGLRVASAPLFVSLLKRDLSQHNSKMRANTTADGWNSSVARMCSKIFDNGWNGTALLESLEVLPLRNGHWEASTSGPFYFPMTGDTEIPKGLDLKVLSKSATTNPDRREFFRHLGATEATYERVRSTIFSSFIDLPTMKFRFTFDCLRYLFLTQSRSKHKDASYKSIRLFTEENELHGTHSQIIYLPGDEYPFNPASLLGDAPVPPNFPVHFLRLGYLSIESKDQEFSLSSYKRWLCDFIGIHERLKILSPNQNEMSQPFQEAFECFGGDSVLVSFDDEDQSMWSEPEFCVWDGPSDLDSVYSLKSKYKRRGLSNEDLGNIGKLFVGTLGVRNISAERIVSELKCSWNSCADEEDEGDILSLYEYLHKRLTVTPRVRASFEESPLIILKQQDGPDWHKTSDCLWSSTTPIRGKVTLEATYEDLKTLFVGKLGVKPLTVQMVYDELRQSPDSSIEGIKVALFSFNNFLQIKDGNWDPEPIKTAKIFPILYPDGTTALRFMDVDFAIADRDILRSKFFDKIALLDFKLEDVHRLRPLFTWLKIQQRYLSRKFATWLMRNPHTNIDGNVEVDIINALTSIFASDRAVLVEILDDQGMIDLQFEDPDEDLNEEMMGGEQAEDNDASDSTPDPGQGTSDLALTPTHSSVTDASIVSSAVQYSEVEERASETEGEIIEIQSRTSHQRIVIECNDQGIPEADMDGMCEPGSEGQSKTFDFRKIIAACKKVHLQSESSSLMFHYNIFDSTDKTLYISKRRESLSAYVFGTRITLLLHDQGNRKDVETLKNIIHRQFEELHDATLIFLKELKILNVEFCGIDEKVYRGFTWKKNEVDQHLLQVSMNKDEYGESRFDLQRYHVTEQPLLDLATTVVLAFPLTIDFEPETKKPIFIPEALGILLIAYKFHVHCDFEIQNMRHNTSTPSSAQMLRFSDHVATALFKAILQFLDHPKLCYQWPMFLSPRCSDSDPFGVTLDTSIRLWIAQNPIFRSRTSRQWRLINHLSFLGTEFEDDDSNPLLESPMNDVFLSREYPPTVTPALKRYGLATFTNTQFLDLLETDLKSPDSKIHKNASLDWKNALARCLSRTFVNDRNSQMRTLPLIQLTDGTWTSVSSGPVYFSTAGDVRVPDALGCRLASHLASREFEQRSLYEKLGVTQATVAQVRQMIFNSFKSSSALSLEEVQRYLHFLYLTHESSNSDNDQPYHEVRVVTGDMSLRSPQSAVIYLMRTSHPYSLESLLDPAFLVANFDTNILHTEISNNGPRQPSPSHPSWKSWLCTCLGIQESFRLSGPKSDKESEFTKHSSSTPERDDALCLSLDYVAKNSSAKFLGVLEHLCEEKSQALEFFDDCGILYIDESGPTWISSSSCLWAAPADMVSAHSLKVLYEKMIHDKHDFKIVADLFQNGLHIQDAAAEDLVQELSTLRDEGCEDLVRVSSIYKYLDKMTLSQDILLEFRKSWLIYLEQNDRFSWFSASGCFWSDADTTGLNRSLKDCYPDLREFFVVKLGVCASAYDSLLNETSDNPDLIKEIILKFGKEFGECVPQIPAKPLQTKKILPVRHPDGTVVLCSVDTDFAIADRIRLAMLLDNSIKILNFGLDEVRHLWPFFEWLEIADRRLSLCVTEWVTRTPDGPSVLNEPYSRDLRRKAHYITRVADTFNIFATYGDPTCLFQRLKTIRVVEVCGIFSEMEIVQDDKAIRSAPQPTTAFVSDDDLDFTIYVSKDEMEKLFSFLPRILGDWLRQDRYPCHTFEVISSLTSIIASDISVLDEILEDQGIV